MVIYSVIKYEINRDKIDDAIQTYEFQNNGHSPHYIVMNQETFGIMSEDSFMKNPDVHKAACEGQAPKYNGIPVALCEYLGKGQVDIV